VNYTELTTAIQEYCENYEATFVANIPVFVRQVEERIHRALMIPELRKNVTGSMTANNRYIARPDDFLSMFSFAVIDGSGNYTYLLDKDMNFMREAYPNPTTTGIPRFYAQFDGDVPTADGNFLLGPTPDQSYAVELQYYYDPPSIVDAGTSWLGENAETALLYGSLLEAYTFMKGDGDMMAVYKSRYDDALAGMGIIDVRSKRDSYRDGDMRIKEQ
jgi:hypothetical protein